MAQRVGDLWPFSSGTSSLGAEMQGGGFTGAIVPFANIHANSGVYHRLSGGSGVIRFGNQGLEFSNDGGIIWNVFNTDINITELQDDNGNATTNAAVRLSTSNGALTELVDGGTINIDVLVKGVNGILATHPTEGQTLINGSPLSGLISMQGAYNGGNEISHTKINGSYQGVVFKDTLSRGLLYPTWFDTDVKNFAIAVSGFSLTPDDPNRSHLLRIASNGILMRGSGVDISQEAPCELFIGYLNDDGGGINTPNVVPTILGSGGAGLSIVAVNGLFIDVPGGVTSLNSGGSLSIGVEGSITMDNAGIASTVIDISAGGTLILDCDTGDVSSRPFQNHLFEPFNGSGRLTYRFGPHEAWAWKPSYASTGGTANDGFFPIPHSGQIASMILASAATLQSAYENDNAVSATIAQGGPLSINASGTTALFLSVVPSGGVHLSLSGVPNSPSSFSNVGDIFLANHSHNLGDPFLVSVTTDSLRASSPGLPTLWLHAGSSGIVSIRTGSGIMQCFNTAATTSILSGGVYVNIPVIGQTNPDRYYRPVPNNSGVRIEVDGLYRITYTASIQKTVGASGQQANSEIRVIDNVGGIYRILGSQSYAQVFDVDSLNRNTANGQSVLDLNASEIVGLFVAASVEPTPSDAFVIPARSANIIFEYLGPQRGNTTTRQAL